MGQFLDFEERQFVDDDVLDCLWINCFELDKLAYNDENCESVMVYYDGWFLAHVLRYDIKVQEGYVDAILINNEYIKLSRVRVAFN